MKNKKVKDIIIFSLIVIYFAVNIINRKISNLDELWNYNFASNIANGLVPYKDFNMVVTPLLAFISGTFLKIIGKELIIFRTLNILLNSSIIFMMYKIMENLQIKDFIKYILIFIFVYLYKDYAMFDYNYAIALVSLIILNLEIKNTENNKKSYQILIGSLAGICITLKQTTGIIITLALLSYKILNVKNKDELKQYFKILLFRILGTIIPLLLMIVFLIINNAFSEFIDYCILGVSTFSNKISYVSGLLKNSNILIKILSIIPISLTVLLIIYIKKSDRKALILFILGIATLSVVYPIADETHLIPGICITIIGISYILNTIIKKDNKVIKIFCIVIIVLFIIYELINGINIYVKSNKNTQLNHYKRLIMEQKEIDSILKINKYIENSDKKVYILDATAAYYMIPLDRYHKNYDMFCLGNFGSQGEQGQIQNLQKEKGSIKLLIKTEGKSRNWQNPEEVRKWVIEKMNKTGQIGGFDIYE